MAREEEQRGKRGLVEPRTRVTGPPFSKDKSNEALKKPALKAEIKSHRDGMAGEGDGVECQPTSGK